MSQSVSAGVCDLQGVPVTIQGLKGRFMGFQVSFRVYQQVSGVAREFKGVPNAFQELLKGFKSPPRSFRSIESSFMGFQERSRDFWGVSGAFQDVLWSCMGLQRLFQSIPARFFRVPGVFKSFPECPRKLRRVPWMSRGLPAGSSVRWGSREVLEVGVSEAYQVFRRRYSNCCFNHVRYTDSREFQKRSKSFHEVSSVLKRTHRLYRSKPSWFHFNPLETLRNPPGTPWKSMKLLWSIPKTQRDEPA